LGKFGGKNSTKKWQKKKQIKKIDDHFFSSNKTRKEWVEIKNWTGAKSSIQQKSNIIIIFFFERIFLGFSDISSQLFVYYYYSYFIWLGLFF